jgi:hypothetical protein
MSGSIENTRFLQSVSLDTNIVSSDTNQTFSDALLVAEKNNASGNKVDSVTSNTVSIPYIPMAETGGDWKKGVSAVAAVKWSSPTGLLGVGLNRNDINLAATLTPISEMEKLFSGEQNIGDTYQNSKGFFSLKSVISPTSSVFTFDKNGVAAGIGTSKMILGNPRDLTNVIQFENKRVEGTAFGPNAGIGASQNNGFLVKLPLSDKLLEKSIQGLQKAVAKIPYAGPVLAGALEVPKRGNPSLTQG